YDSRSTERNRRLEKVRPVLELCNKALKLPYSQLLAQTAGAGFGLLFCGQYLHDEPCGDGPNARGRRYIPFRPYRSPAIYWQMNEWQ
ncbi:hypothetical protein, partial [Aeromonas rivipollensis]|uniref:hypothetical protein n=1 Tax=Aeromonas rivipollensis TaxID=948519 RepID=UPI003D2504BA